MHRMSSVDEFQQVAFFDHIARSWREQEQIVHLTDHRPENAGLLSSAIPMYNLT